ncbi:sensor histidine kinase [Streptacidiphilus sp. PAMC 29251]
MDASGMHASGMDATPAEPSPSGDTEGPPHRLRNALLWAAATILVIIFCANQLQPPFSDEGGVKHLGPLSVAASDVLAALLLRRFPMTVLGLLLTFALAMAVSDPWQRQVTLAQSFPALVALCYIAATRPRRVGLTALGLSLVMLAVYQVDRAMQVNQTMQGRAVLLNRIDWPGVMVMVFAWLLGNSIHQSREAATTALAQATEQAVTTERLRIARELHDMVAHSIGIIAIQAGVGSRVITTQPEEARKALAAIEATSRETLSGLRRTLVALRQSDPAARADQAALLPAPGLADLGRLATVTAEAGVRVEIDWTGERRPLPADIDLSAYRIVQEAVTNVVRHAGTRQCRVAVDYGTDALSLEVVDHGDGGAGRRPGRGFGITGMRERAGLLRGEFSAGPGAGGGFRVAARLPLPEVAAAAAPAPAGASAEEPVR